MHRKGLPEEDMDAVDVSAVQADRVGSLSGNVLEAQEVIGHLWRAGHLTGAVQPQHQQIHHQAVVLNNEGGKLQPSNDAVRVCVVHVLEDMQKEPALYFSIQHGANRKSLLPGGGKALKSLQVGPDRSPCS